MASLQVFNTLQTTQAYMRSSHMKVSMAYMCSSHMKVSLRLMCMLYKHISLIQAHILLQVNSLKVISFPLYLFAEQLFVA